MRERITAALMTSIVCVLTSIICFFVVVTHRDMFLIRGNFLLLEF